MLPYYYCLFMFSCFSTETGNQGLSPTIKDSTGSDVPCPKSCECYKAPTEPLSLVMNNFSMICTNLSTDLNFVNPVFMNTIVYLNSSAKANENVVSASVVLINVNNELGLTNRPVKYVTVKDQKDVQLLYSNAVGIHIEHCQFRDNTYHFDTTRGWTQLRELTIRSSQLETIDSDHFFPNSPLISIDLSDNHLVSVEPLCEDYHAQVLHLYLNKNQLTELPINLVTQFPFLRTLHVYDNRLKVIVNSQIAPLIGNLKEFILFQNSEVYNYNLDPVIQSIDNSPDKRAVGYADSFITGADYRCYDNTKAKWEGVKHATCSKYNHDPVQFRKSLFNQTQPVYLMQSMNITGLAVNVVNNLDNQSINWNDSFNTLLINVKYGWTAITSRNLLMKIQSTERYYILDLADDLQQITIDNGDSKNDDYITWLIKLIKKNDKALRASDNLIALQLIDIDASFADLKPQYGSECPLLYKGVNEQVEQLFEKKIRQFKWFFEALLKHFEDWTDQTGRFIGPFLTVKIDISILPVLRLLMSSKLMQKCFSISPLITAFNIVNIEPNSPDFDKQMADLRGAIETQKTLLKEDLGYVFKNLILQVNLDKNNGVLDNAKRDKLYEISPNIVRNFVD